MYIGMMPPECTFSKDSVPFRGCLYDVAAIAVCLRGCHARKMVRSVWRGLVHSFLVALVYLKAIYKSNEKHGQKSEADQQGK